MRRRSVAVKLNARMRVTRESCGRGAEGSTWARLEGGSKNVPARASAAYYGREAIVEVLLAAGCSVDLPANTGDTLLMRATLFNHAGIVKRLLEAGADKDAQAAYGTTVLRCAAVNGLEAVVEVLLAAGCSVDLPTNDGITPLMGAAQSNYAGTESNHAGTVKLLLDAGADKALVCDDGKTALRHAEQSGNDAIAALLRD